jgi:hypothetical protein
VDIFRVPTALKMPSSWALPEIVASPFSIVPQGPQSFSAASQEAIITAPTASMATNSKLLTFVISFSSLKPRLGRLVANLFTVDRFRTVSSDGTEIVYQDFYPLL